MRFLCFLMAVNFGWAKKLWQMKACSYCYNSDLPEPCTAGTLNLNILKSATYLSTAWPMVAGSTKFSILGKYINLRIAYSHCYVMSNFFTWNRIITANLPIIRISTVQNSKIHKSGPILNLLSEIFDRRGEVDTVSTPTRVKFHQPKFFFVF